MPGARGDSANFTSANLTDSQFYRATVTNSNFTSAHLAGADFSYSVLNGCLFEGTILSNVDFRGTDLIGAKGMAGEQLVISRTSENTVLPSGARGPFIRGMGMERASRR